MTKQRTLLIEYAQDVFGELEEIAAWNEKTYGRDHAKNYIAFLEKSISNLGKNYAKGKKVKTRPDLRYIQIRRKAGVTVMW